MCGLFGFKGKYPDMKLLKHIGFLASTRGGHSFGFVWKEGNKLSGNWQEGSLENHLGSLNRFKNYKGPIVGHCRLATTGNYADTKSSQPLIYKNLVIAHNGNVYNWKEIFKAYKWRSRFNIDSEAFIPSLLYNNLDIFRSLEEIQDSPMALSVLTERRLILVSRGQPLYLKEETNDNIYYCSRRFEGAERIDTVII